MTRGVALAVDDVHGHDTGHDPVDHHTVTMADVQAHASPSDCWSAVDGAAYELTSWISPHPGEPEAIESICGKDATADVRAQHGTVGRPDEILSGLAVGRRRPAPPGAAPTHVDGAR